MGANEQFAMAYFLRPIMDFFLKMYDLPSSISIVYPLMPYVECVQCLERVACVIRFEQISA